MRAVHPARGGRRKRLGGDDQQRHPGRSRPRHRRRRSRHQPMRRGDQRRPEYQQRRPGDPRQPDVQPDDQPDPGRRPGWRNALVHVADRDAAAGQHPGQPVRLPRHQTPGSCENPCDPATQGFQINVVPGVANGFAITNSVISGEVINGDGLNTPDTEGDGGNSDLYLQQDDIGGYTGFGSDMVFTGTLGAPSDNFGPGSISPYEAPGDITNVTFTPVVREAPFVYYDERGARERQEPADRPRNLRTRRAAHDLRARQGGHGSRRSDPPSRQHRDGRGHGLRHRHRALQVQRRRARVRSE